MKIKSKYIEDPEEKWKKPTQRKWKETNFETQKRIIQPQERFKQNPVEKNQWLGLELRTKRSAATQGRNSEIQREVFGLWLKEVTEKLWRF